MQTTLSSLLCLACLMVIWHKPGYAQTADQATNVETLVDSNKQLAQSADPESSNTLNAVGEADINDATPEPDEEAFSLDNDKTPTSAQSKAKRERLDYIQNVITQKITERSQLGTRIEAANEQDQDDLRAQANALTTDVVELRKTLASLAIDGVDDSLFVEREVAEESNWREDVALIAEPVIDSLKEITEKPRRLNELNDLIVLQEQKRAIANEALQNLQSQLEIDSQDVLARSLIGIAQTWRKRRDEATNQIEIANIQIASLQGNKSLPQAIWEGLVRFAKGRGLTILMAAGAAVSVWLGIRFLMRGYRRRLLESREPESRTRYRLAAYSVHLLTLLSILIAIFVVFYERGDVLLLGLLILLIVGLALSIRNLLPQYLREARLLLNIGPMRQAERIHYRGLPWRVESINMYTVLRNPELHGILRIPLSELHGVNSRPAGNDHWFPSSRGDIVLLDEDTLVEVIDQNPDTVELKHRGGQETAIPSSDFYALHMTNLTRGGSFGVSMSFGLDYDLQSISTDEVPRVLHSSIRKALETSNLAEFVRDIEVEMQQAGSSSLDYWIFATLDSRAAKSYFRIRRMMQTACIDACTSQAWNIPFPHVSLVKKMSTQNYGT